MKLLTWMNAYVTIPVATAKNVVKVPNTALRYKPPMPPEQILATYKQYGIEEGERKAASDVAPGAAEAALASTAAARAPKPDSAVVWKLHADNTLEPVKVS